MISLNSKSLDKSAVEAIPGWLPKEAQDFTEHLLLRQREAGDVTGILELGVFKGKYLALLAGVVRGLNVPVVGVDAFLGRIGEKLIPEHEAYAKDQIINAVASVAGRKDNLTLINAYTKELNDRDLLALSPKGFSFISVDAGHDAEDVEFDAGLADRLLTPPGIIAFDDVYNCMCPGVAEGLIRYVVRQRRNIVPFATCGNKVFFCRPAEHLQYYSLSHKIAAEAPEKTPSLAGSAAVLEANKNNNWTPKLFGSEVVTLRA